MSGDKKKHKGTGVKKIETLENRVAPLSIAAASFTHAVEQHQNGLTPAGGTTTPDVGHHDNSTQPGPAPDNHLTSSRTAPTLAAAADNTTVTATVTPDPQDTGDGNDNGSNEGTKPTVTATGPNKLPNTGLLGDPLKFARPIVELQMPVKLPTDPGDPVYQPVAGILTVQTVQTAIAQPAVTAVNPVLAVTAPVAISVLPDTVHGAAVAAPAPGAPVLAVTHGVVAAPAITISHGAAPALAVEPGAGSGPINFNH